MLAGFGHWWLRLDGLACGDGQDRPVSGDGPRRRWLVRAAALVTGGAAGVAGLLALVVYAGGWIVGTAVQLLSRGLVWLTVSMAEGVDLWSLAAQIGGGLGDALATPAGAGALIALEVVAVLALYALRRVIRSGQAEDGSRRHEDEAY